MVTCLGCVPSGSNDCNSLILQQCRTRDITLISLEQWQPRLTAKNLTKLKLTIDLNVIFFRILYIAMCFIWRWLQSMCLPAKQLEISTTNTDLKWSQYWTLRSRSEQGSEESRRELKNSVKGREIFGRKGAGCELLRERNRSKDRKERNWKEKRRGR